MLHPSRAAIPESRVVALMSPVAPAISPSKSNVAPVDWPSEAEITTSM